MIQRPLLNANQENPTAPLFNKSSQVSQHPTKTPGPRAPLGGGGATTGGKGWLTGGKGLGTVGRAGTTTAKKALGVKDGNSRMGGVAQPSFTGKGKQSQALRSPPPSTPLPMHLCTPSPGLHRMASRTILSPDIGEVEVEVEMQVREVDADREDMVEYAGLSARDYDEPFEAEFEMPTFGAALNSIPLVSFGNESYADWEARDAVERKEVRAVWVYEDEAIQTEAPEEPTFALPKIKARQALSSKSSNAGLSRPLALSTSKPIRPVKSTVPLRTTSKASIPLRTTAIKTVTPRPAWGAKPLSTLPTPSSSRPSSVLSVRKTTASRALDEKRERDAAEAELGIWGVVEMSVQVEEVGVEDYVLDF